MQIEIVTLDGWNKYESLGNIEIINWAIPQEIFSLIFCLHSNVVIIFLKYAALITGVIACHTCKIMFYTSFKSLG